MKRLLVLGALIAVVFFLFRSMDEDVREPKLVAKQVESQVEDDQDEDEETTLAEPEEEAPAAQTSNRQADDDIKINQESFRALGSLMRDLFDQKIDRDGFVRRLQSLGLQPIISNDDQTEIEDLSIVRTTNNLPGTRYIHAQFDGEFDEGNLEIQHFAYEIPAGMGSQEEAVELIADIMELSESSREKDTDESMVVFQKGPYIVYVSVLGIDDISGGGGFNAYDPEKDLGSLRIAIQRDVNRQ